MTKFVAPGLHLLIDFWDAKYLTDMAHIERALRQTAASCGATVLGLHLHGFGEGAGITGVAVLAESHISIHTWPEINYIALDVFMCGTTDPYKAVPTLKAFFEPAKICVTEHRRGSHAES